MHINEYGDLVLTEPAAMRALAEPGRLDLFDHLSRRGPLTPEELGVPDARAILQELGDFGLVRQDEGEAWVTTGKGLFFEIPDTADGAGAARALSNVMLSRCVNLPRAWIANDEPRLELEWARASGMLNAGFAATADEVLAIQAELERVLAPYTGRAAADLPDGARRVRVLTYFLPSATETS